MGAVICALGLYVVGSLLRAVVPPWVLAAGIAGVGLLLLLREVGIVKFALPQYRRQVARSTAADGFSGMLQFGFEMGTACRTFLPTGAPHLIAIAVLAFATFPQAVALAVAFGIGRSLVNFGRRVPAGAIGQWRDTSERSIRAWSLTLFVLVVSCTAASVIGSVASSANV